MATSYYAVHRGWHPGELAVQRLLGFERPMAGHWAAVEPALPEHHQTFQKLLHFLPLTVVDEHGSPWTSIACGSNGRPGFVTARNESYLEINMHTWPGDPLHEFQVAEDHLIAGIGVEWATRRRNKFAGRVERVHRQGNSLFLVLEVQQALGNCPKYINVRQFVPATPRPSPVVVNKLETGPLTQGAIDMVHAADTVFISSILSTKSSTDHAGQNQRGGLPGFVRVLNKSTIVLPDYSGNRMMQSLGNIEVSALAGLTMLDYVTGDILYVTGDARTLIGAESQKIMPRQNVITLIDVKQWTLVRNALPVRQAPGSEVERSPYSPPTRYLAAERAEAGEVALADVRLLLSQIKMHSDTDATFTFAVETPQGSELLVQPGQAAIVDLSPLFGKNAYRHMAFPGAESALNDDGIRTWTISRFVPASQAGNANASLSLTIREKRGGALTPKLFALARKLADARPELLEDTQPLDIRLDLHGTVGTFVLPPLPEPPAERRLLWFAGGIGITPFLAMLRSIVLSGKPSAWDVVLVAADHTPDVILGLVSAVLSESSTLPAALQLEIFLFSSSSTIERASEADLPQGVGLQTRQGRITFSFLVDEGLAKDAATRGVYLCGGRGFEQSSMDAISAAGIPAESVHREGFNY
ncbi:hypothetical protein AURDEDRAFT_90358 [Auricularia subglabra TFB-10046 SS5]|nr:hypothetical protein AURDEDRAFT_90358 [Auricularia subglabra TFB-10046 SS5]